MLDWTQLDYDEDQNGIHERPKYAVYKYVTSKKYCIVMDRLGDSVYGIASHLQDSFSLKTVAQIGI